MVLHLHLASHAAKRRTGGEQAVFKQSLQTYKEHCLRQHLGHPTDALRFDTLLHGKPYLLDFSQWQFNFSHSQGHRALVCGHVPFALGIDIESYPRTIRPTVVAATLSDTEVQVYQKHDDSLRYWLRVWTLKEALLKAVGCGIHWHMHQLDTQLSAQQHTGHIWLGERHYRYRCWSHAHYQLAVAWESTQEARFCWHSTTSGL